MNLGLMARSKEPLEIVAKQVNEFGSQSLVLITDLRDKDSIKKSLRTFRNEIGIPDYLINCAGVGYRGYWDDVTLENELEITEVNYLAPMILIRMLLPDMKKKEAHIININSIAGLFTTPYQGAYCASKSALTAYASSLAYELESTNVRISTLFPGPIDTSFLDRRNYEGFKDSSDKVTPEFIAEKTISVINNPQELVFIGSRWKALAVKIANLFPILFRKLIEMKNTPPKKLNV